MIYKNLYIVSLFVIIGLLGVQGESIEELKKSYTAVMMACMAENNVTIEEIKQLSKKEIPDSENTKCLFACAYKKTGMMDAEGKLYIEGVQKISNSIFKDDPVKLKKSSELVETCKTVNDVAVNDGAKGCERAALIFKCSNENGPEFKLF